MSACAIKWCGKNSKTSNFKKDGVTFHRFPKCPMTKSKWIDATFRGEGWFPNTCTVMCSRHFTEDSFHLMKNRRRLIATALPTLYLPVLAPSRTNPEGILLGEKPVTLRSEEMSSKTDVQNIGEPSSSYTKSQNKKRKLNDDSSDDNDSGIEDEYDIWAKECALELRQMDLEQQTFVKRAVSYILAEGRNGLLHRNSVLINNKVLSTLEDPNDLPLHELLVIRKRDIGTSPVSHQDDTTKTKIHSLRVKHNPLHKTRDSNSVTNSCETASAVTTSPIVNTGPITSNSDVSFIVASHKTATRVNSSSSLVKTKSLENKGDLRSSSVIAHKEKITSNDSSSIFVKLEQFEDTGSCSLEIAATVGPSPSLLWPEFCDDTGLTSLTTSHGSEIPVTISPSHFILKSEPNSPPSSPDFTVVVKEEIE